MEYACESIGVRGCSEYDHYLDTYGVTMNTASKLSNTTGKELTETLVNEAWRIVFNDLSIDGFKLKGISDSLISKFTNDTSNSNDSISVEACMYEIVDLKYLNIKIIGTLDVQFTLNGVVTSGTYTDQTIEIAPAQLKYLDFSIKSTGTGMLQVSENGYPFEISYNVKCEPKLFFCEYSEWIIEAVKIKASALILNSSIYSERYNDFVIYKGDKIKDRIVQLDSSFDVWSEERRDGLYQNELKNINNKLKSILKNNKCNCCFECNNIFETKIVTP